MSVHKQASGFQASGFGAGMLDMPVARSEMYCMVDKLVLIATYGLSYYSRLLFSSLSHTLTHYYSSLLFFPCRTVLMPNIRPAFLSLPPDLEHGFVDQDRWIDRRW